MVISAAYPIANGFNNDISNNIIYSEQDNFASELYWDCAIFESQQVLMEANIFSAFINLLKKVVSWIGKAIKSIGDSIRNIFSRGSSSGGSSKSSSSGGGGGSKSSSKASSASSGGGSRSSSNDLSNTSSDDHDRSSDVEVKITTEIEKGIDGVKLVKYLDDMNPLEGILDSIEGQIKNFNDRTDEEARDLGRKAYVDPKLLSTKATMTSIIDKDLTDMDEALKLQDRLLNQSKEEVGDILKNKIWIDSDYLRSVYYTTSKFIDQESKYFNEYSKQIRHRFYGIQQDLQKTIDIVQHFADAFRQTNEENSSLFKIYKALTAKFEKMMTNLIDVIKLYTDAIGAGAGFFSDCKIVVKNLE